MTRSLLRLDRLFTGLLVGLGMAMVSPSRAGGSDVYVVRFLTDITYTSSTECYRVGWRDHLLFRNTTSQDLTVRALGASNGYDISTPDLLTVPSRRNRSLLIGPRPGDNGATNNWTPRTSYVLVVNRLDVPEGVSVESRGELYGGLATPLPCGAQPAPSPQVFGGVALPVVRSLTPAGAEHLHLATDVGSQRSRSNVGVYNAGLVPANATIELRRACDDSIVEARALTIAANSVVQALGFGDDSQRPPFCTQLGATYYSRYVTVVMDQPGFSFVTTLSRDADPKIGVSASVAR